jgi:hypothetical protein
MNKEKESALISAHQRHQRSIVHQRHQRPMGLKAPRSIRLGSFGRNRSFDSDPGGREEVSWLNVHGMERRDV